MIRIFQVGTIVFWLGTIGWLAKTIWTPDKTELVEVDLRRPVSSFFAWNDTTSMVLLESGKKLGEIQVAGFSENKNGDPAGFSLTVILNGEVPPTIMGTFARCLFHFDRDLSLNHSDLIFRMPSNNLKILASVAGKQQVTNAEVNLNGARIFSFNSATPTSQLPSVESIFKASPEVNSVLGQMGDPSTWKWQLKAFRGNHHFHGKKLPIYLLKLNLEQFNQTIRLYLSESGEPLKLETDMGFEAVSEMLAPIKR